VLSRRGRSLWVDLGLLPDRGLPRSPRARGQAAPSRQRAPLAPRQSARGPTPRASAR